MGLFNNTYKNTFVNANFEKQNWCEQTYGYIKKFL